MDYDFLYNIFHFRNINIYEEVSFTNPLKKILWVEQINLWWKIQIFEITRQQRKQE